MRRSFLERRSDPDGGDRFAAAAAAMAWRGPDGLETTDAGDWLLAVARLAITGTTPQPLWSADRSRVIAFNGAVTSAESERRRLDSRTDNDAELPLLRLAEDGVAGLCATAGHFALAIVEPATDRLWLARDPEGEKPLFIVRQEGRVVAFASTLASLDRLGLELRWPVTEVARFLRFGFDRGPELADPELSLQSDLRGATRCFPGRDRSVADPPDRGARAPDSPAPSTSLGDRIRSAVVRCVRAEVPVALSLSGGVDSACLAAALRQVDAPRPGYQFQAVGADPVEREWARRVAAHLDLELRPVDGGPEVLHALPELTRLVGRPLGDPSVLAVFALARVAAADSIRVLLGGEGADELFLGYRRQRALHRLPGVRLPGAGLVPQHAMGGAGRLLRAATAATPYESLLEAAPPGFRRAVLADPWADGRLPEVAPAPRQLAHGVTVDREFYLRHDLLPKLDTALMAAGIEGRCPFLDPEVLDADEARSPELTARLGKRPLRDTFAGDLPAGLFDVRKRGFGLPLDRWIREDDFVADLLRQATTAARPHLRPGGLGKMLDRHRAGRVHCGQALYLVAAYECFLRQREESA